MPGGCVRLLEKHTIGERIRAVRQRAGQSFDRFAEAIVYSRRALINWEQNAAVPPIGVLDKLRHLYDVDPGWMVAGDDLSPRSHYRTTDWDRFDRIVRDVDAACTQVGIDFEPQVRIALVRDLSDDDPAEDEKNRKQLRTTLNSISRGRSA